jgi:uncharacterized membrane protein (DUF106 family)
MVLDSFFNSIFGPLIKAVGYRWSLVIISFILTLLITLAYKVLTKQELMKSLKAELKLLQQELKKVKDHPEKFTRINKQLMEKNLQYFKQSLKPMAITFIPIIIVFGWMRKTYLPTGDLFSWGFSIPFFGTGFGWLMTYIVTSIIFSIIIRKLLKVH